MKIGIIGLGHIGFALTQGLSKAGLEESVVSYDHNPNAVLRVKTIFKNITISDCVENVINNTDLICICIRTPQLEEFLVINNKLFTDGKVVVFLSAGVKMDFIKKSLKDSKAHILRCITNINISSCCGYTFVLKNSNEIAANAVKDLFCKVGKVNEVESESQLDLLSLLSGCAPAIIAIFFESLVESGATIGVSKMQSMQIIEDTIFQTLKTINENKLSPLELKQIVCSPGGILEEQVREVENETDFKQIVMSWFPKIYSNLQKELV